jgi:uncharacterized protein (DUF952 family)
VSLIYHIATAADWERARRDGEYSTSTIGKTLADEGFLHASQAGPLNPDAVVAARPLIPAPDGAFTFTVRDE